MDLRTFANSNGPTGEYQRCQGGPLARHSYEEAIRNNREPQSRWPRDEQTQEARLKPFCQPSIRPTFSISPNDLIFTIGSCFARNIEQHLIGQGFNVAVAGFEQLCKEEHVQVKSNTLNKFVAQSILNELRWALEPGAEFPLDSIVEVKTGRFLDMQLAPGLLPSERHTAVATRRAVSNYMRLVKNAKVVVVTLGLAEAWFDTKLGLYTNTMPLPATAERHPGRFEHHVLEYNQLLACLRDMLALLEEYGHADFRMILTVSPVALGATFTEQDALVANCYSKAVQRAAAEAICRENARVDYLPTFESVTLSEHSFAWREDRAHVSTEVVRLNVLRMEDAYAAPAQAEGRGHSVAAERIRALQLASEASRFFKLGNADRADELFKQAAEIAPSEVLPHVQWGDALYKRQRWQDAVRELEAAAALGGRRYNVAYPLAKCYAKLSQWAAAESAARAALEDDPGNPGPYKVIATALEQLGRGSEAESCRAKYNEMTALGGSTSASRAPR